MCHHSRQHTKKLNRKKETHIYITNSTLLQLNIFNYLWNDPLNLLLIITLPCAAIDVNMNDHKSRKWSLLFSVKLNNYTALTLDLITYVADFLLTGPRLTKGTEEPEILGIFSSNSFQKGSKSAVFLIRSVSLLVKRLLYIIITAFLRIIWNLPSHCRDI